jgi:hypothetical protein
MGEHNDFPVEWVSPYVFYIKIKEGDSQFWVYAPSIGEGELLIGISLAPH